MNYFMKPFHYFKTISMTVVIGSFVLWNPLSVADTTPNHEANQTTDIVSEEESASTNNQLPDQYENFNRPMFNFNDKLDRLFIKPLAYIYNKSVPLFLRSGIHHVFQNIDTIPTVMDDLLEANFYQATSDAWRFTMNSTIGIGGFFDPATPMGLSMNSNDFGLVLAKWGYTRSHYLVLPFFGPTTVRDALSAPINYMATPYPYMNNALLRNGILAFEKFDSRAQLLRFENVYETMAFDKYVFMRNAYLQRRDYLAQRSLELDNPYAPTEVTLSPEEAFLDE